MDHQTFAQLLGNYGEFFGAIAVVVTLIYLAGQLRQNTNALRSASYEHWNQISALFTDFYRGMQESCLRLSCIPAWTSSHLNREKSKWP